MTCKFCVKNANVYDFNCLECCGRLVAKSRPNRLRQEMMLAAIERFLGSPERDAIIEKLKGQS